MHKTFNIPILPLKDIPSKIAYHDLNLNSKSEEYVRLPPVDIRINDSLERLLSSTALSRDPPAKCPRLKKQEVFELQHAYLLPLVRSALLLSSHGEFIALQENFPDRPFIELLIQRWGHQRLSHIPKVIGTCYYFEAQIPETLSKINVNTTYTCIGSLTVEDMNIFHWLYIALPRLIFLASGRFSDTTLLFTYQPSQFQLDTLKHAGINCIIGIVSDIGFYEVEKLLFPTHFDRAFCSNSYVNTLRMLYSNLINREGSTIKIIFPNRNSSLNKRMPSNFGAFNDFINRRAVINIDFSRYSFSEQINFVARAELFLFEHGAAGALIPFTNPKCRIIELLPEGAAYSIYGLPPHYMYLSFASERDYFPVYSRKLGSGFDYDLERLEELLF